MGVLAESELPCSGLRTYNTRAYQTLLTLPFLSQRGQLDRFCELLVRLLCKREKPAMRLAMDIS
jgi:hypothetical protein